MPDWRKVQPMLRALGNRSIFACKRTAFITNVRQSASVPKRREATSLQRSCPPSLLFEMDWRNLAEKGLTSSNVVAGPSNSDRIGAYAMAACLALLCCLHSVDQMDSDDTSFGAQTFITRGFQLRQSTHSFKDDHAFEKHCSSPLFPTISATTRHLSACDPNHDEYEVEKELQLNSSSPIPYKTKLFDGQLLFLVRSQSSFHDPVYFDRFFQTSNFEAPRQFELQLQGKFQEIPNGPLFMGIELADTDTSNCNNKTYEMPMNSFTKALYSLLLGLLTQAIQGGMHYSFGSAIERPHIVGPIQHNVDSCIVTKKDKQNEMKKPKLGQHVRDINGDTESRVEYIRWNTEDVYTFTFSSTFVDLVNWKVVNLPLWLFKNGELDLQVCGGEMPNFVL